MSAFDLYARPSATFDAKVELALSLLRQTHELHGAKAVQSTSLGVEDMVVTDLLHRAGLPTETATLDTQALHAETLALIPQIEARYGRPVTVFSPAQEAVVHFVRQHGERAMYESVELRKACCQVRKMEPLARMLAGRSAWITGLRREQSAAREDAAAVEKDAQGRDKVSPLIDWTLGDVWHYVKLHAVPYNPLHDQFFPSIGCAPCTRAIAVGEDFRAGRWWWEQDGVKECGLHAKSELPAASPLR